MTHHSNTLLHVVGMCMEHPDILVYRATADKSNQLSSSRAVSQELQMK